LLHGEPQRTIEPQLVRQFQHMRGRRQQRENGDDESEKSDETHALMKWMDRGASQAQQ